MSGEAGGGERPEEEGERPEDEEERLLAVAVERMAHQLKNPLQAVAMNLEVVRTRVRSEAPELWEALDRFAGAVDDNVHLLDRRLGLLLALGRRGPGDEAEEVDPARLVRDFAAALRLDREPPGVEVEAEPDGDGLAARVRTGHLLALLLETWRRAAAAGEESCRVRVGPDQGGVRLETSLPGPAEEHSWWRRGAEAAGGTGEVAEAGDRVALRLVLPTG